MFKAGDKVVVIAGPQKGEKVYTLRDHVCADNTYTLAADEWTYTDLGQYHLYSEICLRHATPEEIAGTEKPLRCGDLVEFFGQIGVVCVDDGCDEGHVIIAFMNGDYLLKKAPLEDLKRVGSIRKKVKRIKERIKGGERL